MSTEKTYVAFGATALASGRTSCDTLIDPSLYASLKLVGQVQVPVFLTVQVFVNGVPPTISVWSLGSSLARVAATRGSAAELHTAAGCTTVVTVRSFVMEPLVARSVVVYEPTDVTDVVKLSVDDTLPFAIGVTGFGENVLLKYPVGRFSAESVTGALKPPVLCTANVKSALCPCTIVRLVGLTDVVKSSDPRSGVTKYKTSLCADWVARLKAVTPHLYVCPVTRTPLGSANDVPCRGVATTPSAFG